MKAINASTALLALVLCWSSCTVMALESDARQPVFIDSNVATFNKNQGKGVYEGNVVVTQGSIRINADRLQVILSDGKVGQLIATGNLVRFKQALGKGKEDFNGEALRAEYYTEAKKLVLIGKARLWQGEDTYASDRIEYDSKQGVVRAGQESSGSKRVRSRFLPKN